MLFSEARVRSVPSMSIVGRNVSGSDGKDGKVAFVIISKEAGFDKDAASESFEQQLWHLSAKCI